MAIWYFVTMIFFWYVVIFICAPGIYFDILVAFIIVILLYEVYFFRHVGGSLFSCCISYFGILPVFLLYEYFVFLYYVLYLVYCYLAILCCIFVYLYEYAFLYLVFGISVLALCLLVFLYVSSSVRARTRYVRTCGHAVLDSWRWAPCVVRGASRTFSKRSLGYCTRIGRIV